MAKAGLFVLVLLGTMFAMLMLADAFYLSLHVAALMAIIGALVCLLAFLLVPHILRKLSYRQYRRTLDHDNDLIVSKARYRGHRVLHYRNGSAAALTDRGMRNFETFDDCRRFIDRR